MLQNPYTFPIEEIVVQLHSDIEKGLDKEQLAEQMERYGPNQIPQDRPKGRWRILADQLLNPINYILIVASILALVFSDWLEGVAILVVILISVTIGFFMELQALRSLETLRKIGQTTTRALRGGKPQKIKASELVPGDIILFEAGDVVPADARLIHGENLSLKESMLTGESVSVLKSPDTLPEGIPITDQGNMLFKGTIINTGSGKAIVTATGANTELGKIQRMAMDATKGTTPLEKKLKELSKWLIWLTLFFALLIVVAGYVRGKDLLLMIETGIALAVAAIPEGLPIVATIALAQGMVRLSRKQVIIKKMEAVQTLGATNIICTDKTGTLTEDKMSVHSLILGDTAIEDAEQKRKEGFEAEKENGAFDKMMLASILCNNANGQEEDRQGDSIEKALLHFAGDLGYDIGSIRKQYPEVLELPFDADRKLMATAHQNKNGLFVFAKGAFEQLSEVCDSILEDGKTKAFASKEEWNKKVDMLAAQGMRTLAIAYNELDAVPEREDLAKHLVFLGVIGFIDPAREDVKATIDIYKKAGIRVIMITGDHPKTAEKIAVEIGLLGPNEGSDKVATGEDLKNIGNADEQTVKQLLDATVYARVVPEQKLDLVGIHQKNGNIVGMIGDGINDVPALKKADIGIAMGIRGTEAAREVADVILQNDKFTAIELAIRQGRVVFQNIRQFVMYLLSCNLAEILSVGLAALLNLPAPLLPLQILFLNLVTDVFPALALGLGKGEEDSMRQPPRDPMEPILTKSDWSDTLIYGLSISVGVLGVVAYGNLVLGLPSDTINNMAFYTLVLAQLFNVFNMPKRQESFFKNEVTQNLWVWGAISLSLLLTVLAYLIPPVAKALSLQSLSMELLFTVIGFATSSLILAQLIKRWKNPFGRAHV